MSLEKGYYVGLDVGSGTCGWAVVEDTKDSDGKCLFKLARLKGKDAWGAYIFEEGEDCKKRRGFRSARRRNDRRKYRIYQLQKLFAIPISKKDPTFFKRLNQSAYFNDDKSDEIKNTYPLFRNKKDEKEFYKKYPTIFHLREKLVEGDKEAFCDIRNVYLALHHIIKYRGNFLNEGKYSSDISINYSEEFDKLNQVIKSYYVDDTENCNLDVLNKHNYLKAYEIITSDKTKRDKERELKNLINEDAKGKKCEKDYDIFVTLVSSRTFDFKKELGLIDLEKNKFSFDDMKDEEKDSIRDNFGNKAELFDLAYLFYSDAKIKRLIKHSKEGSLSPLSTSMKTLYEIHKVDLKYIKKILKEIDSKTEKNLYFDFFLDEKAEKNYPNYVHSSVNCGKKPSSSYEINKNIKKIIEENIECLDDNLITEFLNERKQLEPITTVDEQDIKTSFKSYVKSEKTEFFPLISIYSTSIIPHQLHEIELDAILDNFKKYYPDLFIKKEGEDLDLKEKIKAIFLFKIPYYFGPINNDLNNENKYSNIVKNDKYKDEKITIYNLKEVVNEGKTKENFIKKLINTCQYLDAEKVISKSSLLYQEYIIRDRLNALKVNGAHLNKETADKLFEFIHKKDKTYIKDLKDFLLGENKSLYNDTNISGINEKDPFVSSSYACAYRLYKCSIEEGSSLYKKVEEIIKLCTIYADDKIELKKVLINDLKLSSEEIKEFLNLKTNAWAPLSEKLLNGIKSDEEKTIIQYMRESENHLNFQQVYYKYRFDIIVERINNENSTEDSVDQKIENIIEHVPSKLKKSINSSIAILDDIVKASDGKVPSKIYLEVTREDKLKNKNKEKESRVNQIKKLYSENRKEILNCISQDDLNELNEHLEKSGIESKIKGEQVYLYFMQLGRDLYDTNSRIDFDKLISGNDYDVDHIVPKSLTPMPDDSLDNKALVRREVNQKIKRDIYPLNLIDNGKLVNKNNKRFWKMLYEKKLMSKKKYDALIRTDELSQDEIGAFMNAQLNVVSYTNIVLKRVLELKYPESDILFVQAQFASALRHYYGIGKLRIQNSEAKFVNTEKYEDVKPFSVNLNDAHHAVDAYLNIVCGKTLFEKFNSDDNIKEYIKEKWILLKKHQFDREEAKEERDKKSLNMINFLLKSTNAISYSTRIHIIKTCLTKHSPLVVYGLMNVGQELYNQTLRSPKNTNIDTLIPIHTKKGPYKDVSKYGGYISEKIHSYLLYSYDEKKKKGICRLVPIHLTVYKKYEHIKDEKERYDLISKELIGNEENKLKNVENLQLLVHIPLGIKIKYGNNVYQLRPEDTKIYDLFNAYQNYLDELVDFDNIDNLDDEKKFLKIKERTNYSTSRYIKIAVRRFNELNEKKVENGEITLDTSIKGDKYTFSKKRNADIFDYLKKQIDNERFNGVGYLERIRKAYESEDFISYSMQDQILTICCLINLLYKNSNEGGVQYLKDKIKKPYLRPSLTLLQSFSTISESPTGLYRKEKKYFIKK